MSRPLIETVQLKKYFTVGKSSKLHAVDGINIKINKGRTLGVVGESGCGKSTLGRLILKLLPATDGQVLYEGENILEYHGSKMKEMRKNLQIIMQDPYSSLNPRMTVRDLIADPLKVNRVFSDSKALDKRVNELMDVVGLGKRLAYAYPHELDGGRRQRIGVARAISLNPTFIVCDEPVSALDVSIQAQTLNLLMDLQQQMGLTYMFITHDLSVVKHISHDIIVMYLGQAIEMAPSEELFQNPSHPYTKALLSAIPVPDIDYYKNNDIEMIQGEITSPIDPSPGCRFAPRCPYVSLQCTEKNLELKKIGEDHFVACVLCS